MLIQRKAAGNKSAFVKADSIDRRFKSFEMQNKGDEGSS